MRMLRFEREKNQNGLVEKQKTNEAYSVFAFENHEYHSLQMFTATRCGRRFVVFDHL